VVSEMESVDDHGLIGIKSPYPVEEASERLATNLASNGMTVFARIDQQAAAAQAGLTMRPMTLIIFGSPTGGTPLMVQFPSLAIDLPIKALIWEAENGQVWVNINSPEYLQNRHGLPNPPFVGVQGLIEKALL